MSGNNDDLCPSILQRAQKYIYDGEGANVEWVETDFGHLFSIDKPFNDLWPDSGCLMSGHSHNGGHAGLHNCQFDQAGFILNNLYTRMDPDFVLKPRDLDWESKGILQEFV